MTRFFSVIVFATIGGISFAHDDGSTRQAVEKASNKMMTAFKNKDMDFLKSIITSDFKVTAKGQVYDRAKYISMTSEMLAMTKFSSVTHTIHSLKASGNSQAVLRTTTSVSATVTLPNQKPQSLVDVSDDEETWVKQNGVWKLKLDKTISETTKLNGKIVNGTH